MTLIHDINEYRMCAHNFKSPLVNKLFDVLHQLGNLVIVKPPNINEICNDSLAAISRDTIESFIKHRSDYGTLKQLITRTK
jgi:exocyst complex component 5